MFSIVFINSYFKKDLATPKSEIPYFQTFHYSPIASCILMQVPKNKVYVYIIVDSDLGFFKPEEGHYRFKIPSLIKSQRFPEGHRAVDG